MKKIIYIFTVIAITTFMSCDQENFSSELSQKIVVQGYLYANEPVRSFHITELLPYGSDEEEIQSVENASVKIIKDGNQYLLQPDDSVGYYSYFGNDANIQSGVEYQLEVSYNGITATASTMAPNPPVGVEISKTHHIYNPVEITMGGGPFGDRTLEQDTTTITVSWENPDDEYFYVLVESTDSIQEAFVDETEEGNDFPFGRPMGQMRRILSAPQKLPFYRIPVMSLKYYGNYEVKIYRVNEEYADLYETLDQDSRNLTEPASNISNGLGVFTAFASESVFFTIE